MYVTHRKGQESIVTLRGVDALLCECAIRNFILRHQKIPFLEWPLLETADGAHDRDMEASRLSGIAPNSAVCALTIYGCEYEFSESILAGIVEELAQVWRRLG